MSSMQGRQLGSYAIGRQLGKGGFATVYLGRHIHLDTKAAIKVLDGEYAQEEDLQTFRQEARTIADLRHRHIVRMLDFGVEEGTAFLALEYAPFGSLRAQYGANVIPLEAIVAYVQQVASALQYAHRHDIIHLDIKPENMLIDQERQILLSDFGMALLATPSMRTNQGPIGGTAAYMSPEQLQGKPSKNSDQYALAICVYEWLTGSWPFQGQPLEIIGQHLNVVPPLLRAFVPALSEEIEEVVLRGLAKKPEQRFPTVGDFARAFSQAAGVKPRSASEEQFRPLLRATKGGAATQQPRSKITREFASVETIRRVPSSRVAMSSGSSGFPIPRRAVLVGGLAALALGIGGIVLAASHKGGPAVGQTAGAAPTATSSAMTPTTAPTMVPSTTPKPKSTATPTPKPIPTTAPTQPPPPPTATPVPQPPAGTLYLTLPLPATTYSVAWSPDGSKIATGGADKMVRIWDAQHGGLLASYPHALAVTYVAWSPDSSKIASASDDGTCRVCDSRGNILIVYTGGSGNIHSVAWSPDGTRATSGGESNVQLWNPATGNTISTFNGHKATVWGVAWSPDGTRIASGSGNSKATVQDNTVMVWQPSSGNTLVTYTGHTGSVLYVAWSPDGKRIASGSEDMTVQVWDAATGAMIQSYYNHTGTVYGVAWSPDGNRIASGSTDDTVVIWDMRGGGAYTYTGHTGFVFGVAWSPDGTRIASGSADGTVQIWQA